MRSIWDIPAAPYENKLYGHPSPKPLALFVTVAAASPTNFARVLR